MAAKPVSVHEAKTHLSRLLAKVIAGETVIISRSGKPVAKLVPYAAPLKKRKPGNDKGRIADDFDELTPELRKMFGLD